ncbi:MAG: DUF2891 domain-containing protein [Aureispira sp.]
MTRTTSARFFCSFFLLTTFFACQTDSKKEATLDSPEEVMSIPSLPPPTPVVAPQLNLEEANRLAQLPLHCLDTEYPNKLGQVLNGGEDLLTPSQLHPAFYGCFDWHSAVHGHWSLVRLLKTFPDLAEAAAIREKLAARLTAENIQQELLYFERTNNKNFERTYGWAWLLKLAEELHNWDDEQGQKWKTNLQPLTDLIVHKYLAFLPKLRYPIRVGTHTNTAFGLAFAHDYALSTKHNALQTAIETRAKAFYSQDQNCPLSWEPGGYDFLSPCLEEADIMRRILSAADFKVWVAKFLPQLLDKNFSLAPAEVSDRQDGHLVHLDGVNFSRAWCLYGLAETLEDSDHLRYLAHGHIQHSLPAITDGNYEGGHWLASFALYALAEVRQ